MDNTKRQRNEWTSGSLYYEDWDILILLFILFCSLGLVRTCNHKTLGIYYLGSSLLFGISGTLCSMILRLELYSSFGYLFYLNRYALTRNFSTFGLREQTAVWRFQPSSRIISKGERSIPFYYLQTSVTKTSKPKA